MNANCRTMSATVVPSGIVVTATRFTGPHRWTGRQMACWPQLRSSTPELSPANGTRTTSPTRPTVSYTSLTVNRLSVLVWMVVWVVMGVRVVVRVRVRVLVVVLAETVTDAEYVTVRVAHVH